MERRFGTTFCKNSDPSKRVGMDGVLEIANDDKVGIVLDHARAGILFGSVFHVVVSLWLDLGFPR